MAGESMFGTVRVAERIARVAESIGRPCATDVRELLRHSQIGAGASAVNALIFTASAWGAVPDVPLALWLGGSLALFWALNRRFTRARERRIERVSARGARRLALFTALFAAPWALLAAMFVGQGPAEVQAVTLTLAAGMCAGGAFLLHRVELAVAAYVAPILGAVALAALLRAPADLWPVAVLAAPYGAALATVARRTAFAARRTEAAVRELSDHVAALDAANARIRSLMLVDQTSGLPSRCALDERLASLTGDAEAGGFALLTIDLDRFRSVRDALGQAVGDGLIAAAARRIGACLGPDDMVARVGGDEFAAILHGGDAETAETRARDIVARVSAPARVGEAVIHSGASVGLARFPEDGREPAALLSRAGLALSRAKEEGRGRVRLYQPAMEERIAEDNRLERELRAALAAGAVEVHYQPKVCMRTGRLAGAEALLRWRHDDLGWVRPDRLLTVAAARSLLTPVTAYVFDRVARDLRGWISGGIETGPIAVNVHPVDLTDPPFLIGRLRDMARQGLGGDRITLEITEGCVVGRGADVASVTLDAIDELGFQLSLDDFGTGHASLSHLKRLPVRELKIDREFVAGLCVNRSDRAIVSAALEIARCMGIRCVAEGVEEPAQVAALRELGGDIGQGYLWSAALPPSEFAHFAACAFETRARSA
jgi:diguanylate cyclase